MDGLMGMGNGNVYQWPGHMFSFPNGMPIPIDEPGWGDGWPL